MLTSICENKDCKNTFTGATSSPAASLVPFSCLTLIFTFIWLLIKSKYSMPFWTEISKKMGEFSEMVDVGSTFSILMFSTPVWVGGNSNKDSSEGIPSTKNSLLTFAILSIEDILGFFYCTFLSASSPYDA